MGRITKRIVTLISFVFSLYTVNGHACQLSVKNFGAGESVEDNSGSFQRCLVEAAKKGCSCFVPNGNYTFNKDIFMSNGSSLIGQSKEAKLIFDNGGVRGLKNNSVNFYYTNNYNNEVVPNEVKTELKMYAKKGSVNLLVVNGSFFKTGDDIVVFNNILDSWTILEDSKRSDIWNGIKSQNFAKGGSFRVKSIRGNSVILDSPLPFDLPLGSKIAIRSGVSNVTIRNLFIERKTEGYAIHFEQPKHVVLNELIVRGFGGIALSHFANQCIIERNDIDSERGYAINIENFSSRNSVINNKIVFRRTNSDKGGDCAVILLMGSYNNEINNNIINNVGGRYQDFGGIFSHALTFDNRITDNMILGAAEGVGTYYGAYSNTFKGNTISEVRVGGISYYSRSNIYIGNSFEILYHGKENSYGVLDFGSVDNKYETNSIFGQMTLGIQVQGSSGLHVRKNKFKQLSASYSVGVNVLSSDLMKSSIYDSNSFVGYKVR